jgi:peptide/nickel transport system substrate-binding protein
MVRSAAPARANLLGPTKSVLRVDDATVRFLLSDPWPVLPAMLTFQEVVSKSFAEKVGAAGMATQENGTGPFKLVQWRRGDSMVLERFPAYFGGAPAIVPAGKPCIDRVIVKIIPENASRLTALLAGDVAIINELPPHDIRSVEAIGTPEVMAVNGTRTFFAGAEQHPASWLDEVRVRRAANHALNRQLIIDKLLNGRAEKLNGVMSPAAFGFNSNLTEYAYDVKTAKALLAEAGYADGIDVTLDADGPQKEMAEAIAALLTQASIRTKVAVGEGSQVRAKWAPTRKGEGGSPVGNGSLDPPDLQPTLQTGGRGNSAFIPTPRSTSACRRRAKPTRKRAALYQQAQGDRQPRCRFSVAAADLIAYRRGSRAGLRGQRPQTCAMPVSSSLGPCGRRPSPPMTPILLPQRLLHLTRAVRCHRHRFSDDVATPGDPAEIMLANQALT